jgi:FkbM family methyltransferase
MPTIVESAKLQAPMTPALSHSATLTWHPRMVWRGLVSLVISLLKRLYWAPYLSSQLFRKALYLSAPPQKLLLANWGSETFLLSSQDQFIGRGTFISGPYDFDKFEKAVSLLDPGFQKRLLIDIGANIGTICIAAVKRDIFRQAVAVEPEPLNFSLLTCNVQLNGLADRIQCHNLALGAQAGQELLFELSDRNYGDHRIKMSDQPGIDNEESRKTIRVKSEPFDAVIRDVNSSNTLIWMDTQGFEGFVLQGATEALAKRPPMVIEFWPYGLNRSGSYPALRQAVVAAGYTRFYDLDSGSSGNPLPVILTPQSLDDLYKRLGDAGASTDLLFR